MRIFGAKCPHCGKLQLAANEQQGKKVMCAHCTRMFVCVDETGELPFVKTGGGELSAVRFEKQITRAFFGYGIGIPPAMHDMVRSRLSRTLSLGEKMPVALQVGNSRYPIDLKLFENHRGVICLHLLWTFRSGIKKVLENEYPDAYRYYMTQGGDLKHPEWKVEVAVTTEEDVFALDEKRFAKRYHIKSAGATEKTMKLRKSDIEFLEELLK